MKRIELADAYHECIECESEEQLVNIGWDEYHSVQICKSCLLKAIKLIDNHKEEKKN